MNLKENEHGHECVSSSCARSRFRFCSSVSMIKNCEHEITSFCQCFPKPLVQNKKKGLHRNAAPSLGIGLARLEFYKNSLFLFRAVHSIKLEELQQVTHVDHSVIVDVSWAWIWIITSPWEVGVRIEIVSCWIHATNGHTRTIVY